MRPSAPGSDKSRVQEGLYLVLQAGPAAHQFLLQQEFGVLGAVDQGGRYENDQAATITG